MEFEILYQNENYPKELDDFFDRSVNATIFHHPKFLSYHGSKFKRDGFSWKHYIFRKDKKVIAFIPGVQILEEGKKIYKSPFASSMGGFVFSGDVFFKDIETVFELFLSDCRKENEIIYFGTIPACYEGGTAISTYVDYLLLKNKFSVIQSDLLLVHTVKKDKEVLDLIHPKTRTELKQALKADIKVEMGDKVSKQVYDFLLQSQERLQSKPTHSFEELQKISELFPNKIKVFSSYLKNELLGGIICFLSGKNVVNTFYVFDSENGRKHKVNHLNYYSVINWAKENNIFSVDFGASTFGFEPHHPLIFYKEKWDAQPYQRLKYKLI